MRLDRELYNQEWLDLFPHSKLFHTHFGFLDHLALLTKIKATLSVIPRGHKHRFFFFFFFFFFFWFEALWTRIPKCEEVIRYSWDSP